MVMFAVLTENILDHQLRRVLRDGDRPICMNLGDLAERCGVQNETEPPYW